MLSSSIAASQQQGGGKKRIHGPPPQPTLPAVRHAILELFARPPPHRCPHCHNRIRNARRLKKFCQSIARGGCFFFESSPLFIFFLEHDFSKNPFPTLGDHALAKKFPPRGKKRAITPANPI